MGKAAPRGRSHRIPRSMRFPPRRRRCSGPLAATGRRLWGPRLGFPRPCRGAPDLGPGTGGCAHAAWACRRLPSAVPPGRGTCAAGFQIEFTKVFSPRRVGRSLKGMAGRHRARCMNSNTPDNGIPTRQGRDEDRTNKFVTTRVSLVVGVQKEDEPAWARFFEHYAKPTSEWRRRWGLVQRSAHRRGQTMVWIHGRRRGGAENPWLRLPTEDRGGHKKSSP